MTAQLVHKANSLTVVTNLKDVPRQGTQKLHTVAQNGLSSLELLSETMSVLESKSRYLDVTDSNKVKVNLPRVSIENKPNKCPDSN